ncbi:MAG: hypothetical protein CMQ41_15275, partial [Gammaproteobacteria bacterium]|nr:hypothetical protein [Gammaproteobacteria bacterium]
MGCAAETAAAGDGGCGGGGNDNDNDNDAVPPTFTNIPSECVFPFDYQGTEYTTCTDIHWPGTFWCSKDDPYTGRYATCTVATTNAPTEVPTDAPTDVAMTGQAGPEQIYRVDVPPDMALHVTVWGYNFPLSVTLQAGGTTCPGTSVLTDPNGN